MIYDTTDFATIQPVQAKKVPSELLKNYVFSILQPINYNQGGAPSTLLVSEKGGGAEKEA